MTKLIENLDGIVKQALYRMIFKESIHIFQYFGKVFNYEAYKKLFKFYKPKVALLQPDSSEILLISHMLLKKLELKQ